MLQIAFTCDYIEDPVFMGINSNVGVLLFYFLLMFLNVLINTLRNKTNAYYVLMIVILLVAFMDLVVV